MKKRKDFRLELYGDLFLLLMLLVVNFWRYDARFVFDAPFLVVLTVLLAGTLCNALIVGMAPDSGRSESEEKGALYGRFNRMGCGTVVVLVKSLMVCAWGYYVGANSETFFSWRGLVVVAVWLVAALFYVGALYLKTRKRMRVSADQAGMNSRVR